MADSDYEILRDAILYVFTKRKTAFLMTESILKEIHFQKEIFPKEDKERLDGLLETMREKGLVTLNQPKFAALTPEGKEAGTAISPGRLREILDDMERRIR